jgi:diacylglycerol kinase family enzyme
MAGYSETPFPPTRVGIPPPMKAVVLLNSQAGSGGAEPERVGAALAAAGVDAEVRAVPGDELPSVARAAAAAGAAAVVAAGGDGTVAAVAGALAGTPTPLGILPLGTFNHFARDLGLPLDLRDAARVIAAGRVRPVDVGEANGRVFVNNASIGLYPLAVRDREARRVLPRKLAMVLALLRMVARLPLLRLRLRIPGADLPRRTPILFVGNNAYEMRLLAPQRRPVLDGGALQVLVVRRRSRIGLVALALRALAGRLDAARDLEALAPTRLEVWGRAGHRLLVATDGEVHRMEAPVALRIRPRDLRVLAP